MLRTLSLQRGGIAGTGVHRLFFLLMPLLLLAALLLSACTGAVQIPLQSLWPMLKYSLGDASAGAAFDLQHYAVLTELRLPRVLMALLIGSALGVSGAAMQGLFRNPLADPGLIGVSSGASLFAVLSIVLQTSFWPAASQYLGYWTLAASAFAGAALSTFLVYRFSKVDGKAVVAAMLLAGIAINALAGALTGLCITLANDSQLRTITFWSLGSLGGVGKAQLPVVAPVLLFPILALPMLAKPLNALALGEQNARYIGIDVRGLKRKLIVLTTLAVGVSVSVAGIIGFIGLVIPHTLRLFLGADHRHIMGGSALLGGTVLVLADLLSRTIIAPAEMPIGIVTALLGTPVFFYLLIQEKKNL